MMCMLKVILKPIELKMSVKIFFKILFLIKDVSIKHFESMSDLFLVYCHIKHCFKKDEVIKLFDHAARSLINLINKSN